MIVGEPNGFDMTRLMPKEVKFAELIVKECASIVDIHGRWILHDKLAVKIKRDFGVEK